MLFMYGMRNRPFSIGTFPKEGFDRVVPEDLLSDPDLSGRYHDVLVYNRKLSDEELYEYELDYIGRLVKAED